ncbi:MAG: hypothetical protein HQ509_09305, partial [Candidatus Marinimicrobia bacterium]|nr:hypothetical protein [Candidatus Neomarinimicrobiota bacterium]
MYIESSPYFENCSFTDNTAYQGGAAFISSETSEPQFINCSFNGNSATDTGGAIATLNAAEILIDRCVFDENSATSGGGALAIFYYNQTQKWATISNSLFINNSNTNAPGAAIAASSSNVHIIIEHTTITNNYSSSSNPAVEVSNAHFFNSIIWDNSTANDGWPISGADIQITNSLIENGGMVPGFNYANSLDIDPLFTDPANDDYTLSLASHAIGAGVGSYSHPRNGSTVNIEGLDLADSARVQPANSNPDLGAYERAEAETPYPDSPTNLSAEELHREVRLSWDSVDATDVAYYIIYQAIEPDS